MAAWEERLNQLERNFLAEVERLKVDILGQLQVDDDKYYNIDNEVNTSFTSPSPSSAYTSPSSSPSSSFLRGATNGKEEHFKNVPLNGERQHASVAPPLIASTTSFSSSVTPVSLRQNLSSNSSSTRSGSLSSSSSSASPPPALPPPAAAEGDRGAGGGKSRRVAPARQAEALVVRVRATYKFDSQEEDELPLPKGLELIAFMREDESWWWGQRPDGTVGIFPSNFVTVLEGDPEALPIREDDPEEPGEHQPQPQEQDHHQQSFDASHGAVENASRPKPPPPAGPKPLARQGSQQRLEKMKVSKGAASPPPAQRSSSYSPGSRLSSSGSFASPTPQLSSSGSSAIPTLPVAASTPAALTTAASSSSAAVTAPPRQRPSPPPPSAHLKPATLLGASVPAASPADLAQGNDHSSFSSDAASPAFDAPAPAPTSVHRRPSTASAPHGRAPLAQDRDGSSSPRPAVPRPSLKPTQRGEASRKDWHDKRKSIMMLQEQSRTTHLLAQWEQAGAGITFAPPPSRPL